MLWRAVWFQALIHLFLNFIPIFINKQTSKHEISFLFMAKDLSWKIRIGRMCTISFFPFLQLSSVFFDLVAHYTLALFSWISENAEVWPQYRPERKRKHTSMGPGLRVLYKNAEESSCILIVQRQLKESHTHPSSFVYHHMKSSDAWKKATNNKIVRMLTHVDVCYQ